MYIHKTANLWLLKRNPTLDLCSLCNEPRCLHWIHEDGVCHDCIFSHKGREKFLSQSSAWFQLGLRPDDLKNEKYCHVPNPKNSGFSPAKIYLRCDLELNASKKFGSVKKARIHRSKMVERTKDIRKRRYDASKNFHMKLRKGRTATHSTVSGESEYATMKQLRYLSKLGQKEIVELSKKRASEMICDKVKVRFKKRATKPPCFSDASLGDCALYYFFLEHRPNVRSENPNLFEPGIDVLTKKKWDHTTEKNKEIFFTAAKKERRRQRRRHRKKCLEVPKPKKAKNGYVFFFEDNISHFRKRNPDKIHREIVKLVGLTWNSLSEKERKPCIERARMDKTRHEKEMEIYKSNLESKRK